MKSIFILPAILLIMIKSLCAQDLKSLKDRLQVELGLNILNVNKSNFVDEEYFPELYGGFGGGKVSLRFISSRNNYWEIGVDINSFGDDINPLDFKGSGFILEKEKIVTYQFKRGLILKRLSLECGLHYSRGVYERVEIAGVPEFPDALNEDLGLSFDFHYSLFSILRVDWINRINMISINGGNAGGFMSGIASIGFSVLIN